MNSKAEILRIANDIESLTGQRTKEAGDKRMLAASEFLKVAKARLAEARQILGELLEEGVIREDTQLWLNDRINEESCLN